MGDVSAQKTGDAWRSTEENALAAVVLAAQACLAGVTRTMRLNGDLVADLERRHRWVNRDYLSEMVSMVQPVQ